MPLLEMKSNLSFSTTVPSNNITSPSAVSENKIVSPGQSSKKTKLPLSEMKSTFGITSSPTPNAAKPTPILPKSGVDYFTNTNAFGFRLNKNGSTTTDYILNSNGGPIIPQTVYRDIKGDSTSIFTPFTKASVVYNLNNTPTPLQQISKPTNNPVDSFGAFVPINNSNNKFNESTSPIRVATDSRLFKAHTDSNFLNNLYTSFKRKDNKIGLSNQPRFVRNVGERFGDGGIDGIPFIPAVVEATIDAAASTLGKFASPLFGRDISTFVDSYKAGNLRIGKFALDITYNIKQIGLHRQNKYDKVYSQHMGMGTSVPSAGETMETGVGRILSMASDNGLLDINPKVYNQGSIFSVPGVPGLMFNRNGRNIQDIVGVGSAALETVLARGGDLVKVGSKAILNNISDGAIILAEKASAQTIRFKGIGSEGASKLLGGIGNVLGRFNLPSGGGSLPGSSFIKNQIKKFPSISLPSLPAINKAKLQKIRDFGGSVIESAATAGKTLGTGAANLTNKTQKLASDISKATKTISKAQASKLDAKAFENVGVDKVNLIPVGETEFENTPHEKLDLIRLRFDDARTGSPIIFPAIISGLTDTFSPSYSPEQFVGRPDNVYVYTGTTREISFTFDVYPKSDRELIVIWSKLNSLAGMTYPHMDKTGKGMIAPFSKLTIGQMYDKTPGYISALSYTIQDNTTWEVDFAKLPKYVQVACSFNYIGDRLPTATQKHFECPWIGEVNYSGGEDVKGIEAAVNLANQVAPVGMTSSTAGNAGSVAAKKFRNLAGF